MLDKMQALAQRYREIEALLGLPEVASDPARSGKLAKERSDLQPVVEAYLQLCGDQGRTRGRSRPRQ